MDVEAFEKRIGQYLKKLREEQVLYFAWHCAVRALPFLSMGGNFNYWEKQERQQFLYTIFSTLDKNIWAVLQRKEEGFYDVAGVAVENTEGLAFTAHRNTVAYAIFTVTDAVYSLLDKYYAVYAATDLIYAVEDYWGEQPDFISLLLRDLRGLKMPSSLKAQELQKKYDKLWSVWEEAMRTEDCAYWGRLYRNIYRNGFTFDREALKRRLSVPKEIREQGAAAVGHYLEELEKQGAIQFNEARIIILGDKGAGKTSLARRLIDPKAPMTEDNESTAGVDTLLWELEKQNVNVHIWDFAGHTVTHAVHQFFLSEHCLYIIVYDGRTEGRNRLEYWLNHMTNYGGDSEAIILVNERDLHKVDIPINSLKEQYPIAAYYSFSIRDNKSELADFREFVVNYINSHPSWNNQEIPQNYYKVKEELEEYFIPSDPVKKKEHITKSELERIARKYYVQNIEILLKNLHALGISLWYKDMEEFDTLVLNPEWISQGVYKIINWVHQEQRYSLTLKDFETVFREETDRYPVEKHPFIFRLMIFYELAYETKEGGCLIIPHLLQEDRPVRLPDFPIGNSLMLQYRSEQPLPPNTVSRFIVRHNREIKHEGGFYQVWRYGAILEDGCGTIALVREEDRTISVSVKGFQKTAYLTALRKTLNDIFNSYKTRKPELRYAIKIFGEIPGKEEGILWLTDKKIFNHAQDKVPYYDDIGQQNIDMDKYVVNYNINAENIIGGKGILINKSVRNNFNFYDCNIRVQGCLNDLAQLLNEKGKKEEARELETMAGMLEKAESYKTPEEMKKKGVLNRLKRLTEELGNPDSHLSKIVEGVKAGVNIAKDIIKGYNDLARWVGLD